MGLVARFFCGLRFRLLLLILLVCLPLAALALYRSAEEKSRQALNWQLRAERAAQAATREEMDALDSAKQLFLAVARSSAVKSGESQAVQRLMGDLLAASPKYSNLGLLNPDGMLVVSAGQIAASNFSNQVFYKHAVADGSFSLGTISRLPGRTPTLDFGYPVYDDDRKLLGVIFASLDLHWIDSFGSQLASQLPKDATWTEIDKAGHVLWRHPLPEAHVGKTLQDKALVQAAFRPQPARRLHNVEGTDLVASFAQRHSRHLHQDVAGILMIPEKALFRNANKALAWQLLWLSAATGFAVLLGMLGSHFLVLKPIETLARTSTRLAGGDLTVRTGLRHKRNELGELTLAFDCMAEALEHREHERLKTSQKLHVLSHRLVEVQESERRHIARELHDEIGQTLTAAEMNLQAALQAPRAPNIERRLQATLQAVEQVLRQVHDLSLNLRPSMLDDLGLEPALRWLTRRQAELGGIQAEFHADRLEHRLHPVVETECFRVAQEALTNIVRHANARNLSVTLSRTNTHLHLRVRDDGAGFDVAEHRNGAVLGDSLGLLSMEERASLASGGLEVTSSVGHGAEVHAWFPIRWRNGELPDANWENGSNLDKG